MNSREIAERIALQARIDNPFTSYVTDLLEKAVKTGYKIGLEDGKVLGETK